jgi:hypothetical protein
MTPRGELKIASAFLATPDCLALAQLGHRLFQHFGVREQIIPDDGLDIPALAVGKTLRRCQRRRAAECERKQCGSEQAERRHLQNPLGESRFPKDFVTWLNLFLVVISSCYF